MDPQEPGGLWPVAHARRLVAEGRQPDAIIDADWTAAQRGNCRRYRSPAGPGEARNSRFTSGCPSGAPVLRLMKTRDKKEVHSVSSEKWGTRGAPAQFPCWTAWLAERLREMGSPYAAYYHSGLETQIMPVKDDDLLDDYGRAWPVISDGPRPVRTVVTDKRGKPIRSNDGVVDFHPALIRVAGTSWWNWQAGRTEACYFDFDFGMAAKRWMKRGSRGWTSGQNACPTS